MAGHPWVVGGFGQYGPYGLQAGISWQWTEGHAERYAAAVNALNLKVYYDWSYKRMFDPLYMPTVWQLTTDYWSRFWPILVGAPEHWWVLGNEPELPAAAGQGVATPAEAAIVWKDFVARTGITKAIFGNVLWTNSGNDGAKAWLNEFCSLLGPNDPVPDYWGVHFHWASGWEEMSNTTKPSFMNWINSKPARFQKAWFITELTVQPQLLVVEQKQAVLWAAKQITNQPNVNQSPWLRGVFWYEANSPFAQFKPTNLMKDDASGRTALGDYFNYVKSLSNPGAEPYPKN